MAIEWPDLVDTSRHLALMSELENVFRRSQMILEQSRLLLHDVHKIVEQSHKAAIGAHSVRYSESLFEKVFTPPRKRS